MQSQDNHFEKRRKVLTLLGVSAVAMPVLGLTGCGGDNAADSAGAAKMQKDSAEPGTRVDSGMSEAEKSMQSAQESMGNAMDSAEQAAGEAMDSAKQSAGEAVDSAKQSAGEAVDSAKQAAGEAMDSATKAADQAMDSAGATGKKAMQDAKNIATDAAGGMARVDEKAAQAKSLGYRHDATTVDKAKFPRYAAGQHCGNCAIYQGGSAAWGGCPLFGSKQVKATGWCSAYTPAS